MTYAGVDLINPTDELMPIMCRWWDEHAPDMWSHPGYLTNRVANLPIPGPPKQFPARLNTLYWPTGASRWGVFHGLVGQAGAEAILDEVGGNSPEQLVVKNLVLTDPEQEQTVTASMFLLDMRPAFNFGSNKFFWVSLVDMRYHIWGRFCTGGAIASWTALLELLIGASGISGLPIPTINANYGIPTSAQWSPLTTNAECIGVPIPLLIDAAARLVGLRFTFALNGVNNLFKLYSEAQTIDQANYDNNSDHVVWGGRNTARNIIGSIPSVVGVRFAGTTHTRVDVSLASLALAEYVGLSPITSVASICMDQLSDVASPTTANAATQAATDYYKWALSLNDVTFRGIRQMNPSGLEDRLEWEYRSIGRRGVTEPQILSRIVPVDKHDRNTYGDRRVVDVRPIFIQAVSEAALTPPENPADGLRLTTTTVGSPFWTTAFTTYNDNVYAVTIKNAQGASLFQTATPFVACHDSRGIMWEEPEGSGRYAYLPIQYAGRQTDTGGAYYAGFMSTGDQEFDGAKTFRRLALFQKGLQVQNVDIGGSTGSLTMVASVFGDQLLITGGAVNITGNFVCGIAGCTRLVDVGSGLVTHQYTENFGGGGETTYNGGFTSSGVIFKAGLYISGTVGSGSVTSVAASGGTTGLSFTGSPITTNGTLTLTGTLVVANGGSGLATVPVGAVLAGNGTSPFDPLTDTRANGEALEMKGASNFWVGVGTGSF